MAVLLALSSALMYGIADFSGGLASRRSHPLAVTAGAQLVGLSAVPIVLVLIASPFSLAGTVAGAVAGLFGGLGLALYFTALRDGTMAVVSPLSAVAAAGIPVVAGVAAGERPHLVAVLGIMLALPAVYLAARSPADAADLDVGDTTRRVLPPGVLLGIASGVSFGLFFVLLDVAPDSSGAWPLLGSKIGSLSVVVLLGAVRRRRLVPSRASAPLVVASGLMDMMANLAFLLATRVGLLSLVSVIASQYPVIVVILSLVVLRERLAPLQRAGIGLALVAVTMISLG